MKTKQSMVDLFNSRVEQVIAEKTAELKEEFEEEVRSFAQETTPKVFFELLEENKNYLSLWVVRNLEPIIYNAAYLIGKVEKQPFFYQRYENLYISISSKDQIPIVESVAVCDDNILRVLRLLESQVSEKESFSDQVVAPPGFYVFKYSSKFVTSASEGERTHHTQVFKADSIREALNKLNDIFVFASDNVFLDCWVFFEDRWHEVKEGPIQGTHLSANFDVDKVARSLEQVSA